MEVLLSNSGQKGSLTLWDLSRCTSLRQYRQSPPAKKGCTALLAESFVLMASDKKLMPSGSIKTTDNSKTLAWVIESENVHSQSFIAHPISALVGSPCGQYIYGGTSEGTLVVWHAPSGRQVHLFANHFQPVTTMKLSPDGSWLALGSSDGVIQVLKVPLLMSGHIGDAVKQVFSNHSLPLTDLAFSSTSTRLYSCSVDQTCKIWCLSVGSLLCSIFFPTVLTSVALSPMEESIYVGGSDGNVYKYSLWDIKGNEVNLLESLDHLPQIYKGENQVTCMDVNLDGSLLVTGADDGCIRVWSSSTGQLLKTVHQQKGAITYVKIILKSPSILVPGYMMESKLFPPLLPLSTLLHSSKEEVLLPTKLPSNNLEDKLLSDVNLTKHITKKIKISASQFKVTGNNGEDMEMLKSEIEQLKEVNKRWKTLNNSLLEVTLTNT
eukprot:TRINITY_DN2122_c0_g1_i1.p1 TRINITY_DN2122_c0_g1~~TRINITY_DN2122_c0_g1_i1.p1  ORF type:complete len:460 (-),score=76.04 TRINITY_DN2122_c0_g1_i1:1082-2389(-)